MNKKNAIAKKITGFAVVDHNKAKVEIIVPPKPDRDDVLQGYTYKIHPVDLDCAMYITINNLNGAPYEIFVNCSHLESHEWVACVTRLISAIWQNGGDSSFVAQSMRSIFSPKGGYFLPKGGGLCPSVVAHIGIVIERHINTVKTQ